MGSGNGMLEYEKVIQYIYQKIQDGSLTIGSRLPTERAIAEELGLGRNSIREALSMLHGMGMIERKQGSGNYIAKNAGSSIKQIVLMMLALGTITRQDVCGFRRTMEKSVCMLLLENEIPCGPGKILADALTDMEWATGQELVELDKTFHDALILATGNQMFITMMEAVTEVYREWIDRILQMADATDKEKLLLYHRAIYETILEKDKAGVMHAIDAHYDLIEAML